MPILDFEALKKTMLAERAVRSGGSCSAVDVSGVAALATMAAPSSTPMSAAPLAHPSAVGCLAHSPWKFKAPTPLPAPVLSTLVYGNEAVSVSHETALLCAIRGGAPWVELRARRLQQWTAPLPPFLQSLADGLVAAGVFPSHAPPNHALINGYEPGEGIDAHTDGPFYTPLVATISLGDDALMRFKPRAPNTPHVGELVLRRRSIVITSGALYTDFAHEIERSVDFVAGGKAGLWNAEAAGVVAGECVTRKDTRISITLRHALPETTAE